MEKDNLAKDTLDPLSPSLSPLQNSQFYLSLISISSLSLSM
jgi:chromosome segregation ATPase